MNRGASRHLLTELRAAAEGAARVAIVDKRQLRELLEERDLLLRTVLDLSRLLGLQEPAE
jgi:hypothetical protein